MILKDIMQTKVITIPADTPVDEVARILLDKGITGAPVEEHGKLVGVVSLSDLAAHPRPQAIVEADRRPTYYRDDWGGDELDEFKVEQLDPTEVRNIMTPVVFSLEETASVREAAELMLISRIHRLVVTHHGKAVGIVTTTDMMRLIPLYVPEPALPT